MLKIRTLLVALVVLLAVPSAASASITLGPENPNPNPAFSQAVNWVNNSVLFTHTAPAGVQLTAPTDGVITSWLFYTDEVGKGATAQLRTLTPKGGKDYVVTGGGPAEPLREVNPTGTESHNVLHTISSRVPISAGQIVGVTLSKPTGGVVQPVLPAEEGKGWEYGCLGCIDPLPPDGTQGTATVIATQWFAMNAKLEPDTDHDGYGDETQDSCVGACQPPAPAPATTVKKKKKCKKGKKLKRGKCVKKHKKKHKKPKK